MELPRLLLIMFGLISLVQGDGYIDLTKDACFTKIYACQEYRSSITDGNNTYATGPDLFDEICRSHEDFMICLNNATEFCNESGNITDIAALALDNRKSLQRYCEDESWRKDYFDTVSCINSHEETSILDCQTEESTRDDKPWECLAPEPCEMILRVVNCTARKIENSCNSVAAEVFKRLYFLKVQNQDVICEYRTTNCRYQTTGRPHRQPRFRATKQPGLQKRSGPIVSSTVDIITDALGDIIFNTIDYTMNYIKQKSKHIEKEKIKSVLNELYEMVEEHYHHEDEVKNTEPQMRYFKWVSPEILDTYANEETKKLCSTAADPYTCYRLNTVTTKLNEGVPGGFSLKLEELEDFVHLRNKLLSSENLKIIEISHEITEYRWKNIDFIFNELSCKWIRDGSKIFKCHVKYLPSDNEKLKSIEI